MAIALDIIKKKSWLDDTLAQQALDIKNSQWNDAFKAFVTKNKPVQPVSTTPIAPAPTPAPQPIVNAPVDKTTGLSTPLAPAVQPNTPVTPTAPKVDATPWITQDSFNQAKAESEKIKAQNEAQMALNKQQSELRQTETAKANEAKTAEAKQVQDQANTQLANNEWAILNTLKVGGIIPEQVKSSPYYKTALATYNKMQQYSTYSIGQLTTALNQWNILPWTSLYNEMMKDPALKTKLTEAQIYTSSKPTDKTAMYENASTDILSSNPKTANMLADGVITVDEYNQATNNDAIMAKAKEVEEKTNKYNALYAEYEAIPEKIRADFPGSPFADAMIADAQNAKYKAVILARWEMNSADGTLTELKAQASSLFETNLKLYQDQQIEANKIKAEQRATENALALSQAQFEQWLAQQTQLTNDPTTAITTMIDEYKKLGVPFSRSTQQIIQDFESSGKDLPTYLSELQGLIQSKPEYKRVQAIQQGQMSDAEKLQATQAFQNQSDIRNFAQQKELAKFNNDLNRQEFLFKIENDPEQKAKALTLENSLNANKSLFDVLGKNVGTYEGNRGYDLAWNLWDPLPAGGNWTVKSIDTAGEQVGSIFIGGKGKKPYGNTVVMQDENGNEIRYSHLQNIWVKEGDILGFGDIVGTRGNTGNVKGANGETLTAEQLKAGRGAHLDVEIKSKWADWALKLLSNADQVNFLKGLKATPSLWKDELKAISTARTNLEQDPQYKAYRTLANQVADVKWIQSRINNWTASPQDQQQMITAFSKVLDPTSVVRESEFELTKKYWQAGYQALLQNVSQYWRWDWILNPWSAKILAESLANRYGSIEQEYNNQLQLAKDNIEMNIGRWLSNKEFETLTQTKFSNQTKPSENSESNDPFGIR